MKRLIPLLFLILQGGGQPINIPVTANGWTFSHGPGGTSNAYGINGCHAGYVGTCTQDLGISPEKLQGSYPVTPGFYTITLTVVDGLIPYPSYYDVKLSYGTQELCDSDGWTDEKATTVTFVCPSPGYLIIDRQLPNQNPAQGKNNLILSFTVSYWVGNSDDFSLTFTPSN